MRCYYKPVRKFIIPIIGDDVEQLEFSYMFGANIKSYGHFGKLEVS